MLVACAGLKKSGSGWFFNLTNRLLARSIGRDVHEVIERYGLVDVLRDDNARLGSLRVNRLARLRRPLLAGETFAVKTHAPPRPLFEVLCRTGRAQGFLTVRDPRDLVVSALDHARIYGNPGVAEGLSGLEDTEAAVDMIAGFQPLYHAWARCPGARVIRYEDLIAEPVAILAEVAETLHIDADEDFLRSIVDDTDRAGGPGLHRNVGGTGRYLEVLSPRDQELCEQRLAPLIEHMGYGRAGVE